MLAQAQVQAQAHDLRVVGTRSRPNDTIFADATSHSMKLSTLLLDEFINNKSDACAVMHT